MACTSVDQIRLENGTFFTKQHFLESSDNFFSFANCTVRVGGFFFFFFVNDLEDLCKLYTEIVWPLEESPLSGGIRCKCCWSSSMQTCALSANYTTSTHTHVYIFYIY